MAVARVKTWITTDSLLFSDLNAEFDNLLDIIQNQLGTNLADGSITEIKLASGASPAVFFGEIFADEFVVGTGLAHSSSAGLVETITLGTAYILNTSGTPDKLLRVDKTAATSHTMADDTTNFIDLSSAGVFSVNANGAPAADHTRLLQVITSGGSISSTKDLADRVFPDSSVTSRLHQDNVEWACSAATTAIITSGTHFRDNGNNVSYTFDANQTVDITASGANGLDQGSEASGTWYALVAIGDPNGVNVPKGMFVKAADFPSSIVLPSGYSDFRRIGWVRNDGSSNFIQGIYFNNQFWYEDDQNLITTGSSASFAAIDASSLVPPTEQVIFVTDFGSAGDRFTRVTGNGASTGNRRFRTADELNSWIQLTDSSQSFDYKTSGGSATIDLQMYQDNLDRET